MQADNVYWYRVLGIGLRRSVAGLSTLIVAGFLLSLLSPQADAAVGAISGKFTVLPTGQAAYVIPLPAPGGAGGLSPHLSLVYAKGLGVGLMGWDATVEGISKIRRCPSMHATDGSSKPVDFTSADRSVWMGKS